MLMVRDGNIFQRIAPVHGVALRPDRPWRKGAFNSLVTWLRVVYRSIFFSLTKIVEK